MTPDAIVDHMFANDKFSQWLGINILEQREGYCKVQMEIRPEMTNGFGIAHGGITYSLADSALAFASNNGGRKAVSIETAISHIKMLLPGDVITAIAHQLSVSNAIGIYEVKVTNASGELVALFKGTVYRKKEWANAEGQP